jgi:hypothetical protein
MGKSTWAQICADVPRGENWQRCRIALARTPDNTVRQMLKNWRKQALVVVDEDGQYRKVNG